MEIKDTSRLIASIKYFLGQSVYIRTDMEQYERIITGINIRPTGVVYVLSFAELESYHYDFEISDEPNLFDRL